MSSTSAIDFHKGAVLWKLSNTYNSLMLALIEAMQNGIDAEADTVFIGINLKTRNVHIADNGNGVSQEKFEQALTSVGMGIKAKDKLGQFGLGLIAPLNKCRSFSFTSCPIGTRQTLSWTFNGEEIRKQHEELQIPRVQLDGMPELPKDFRAHTTGKYQTGWRTMVVLKAVTKDRVVSIVDLDELESQARSKLGQAMRERGTTIRVVLIDTHGRIKTRDINPVDYTGEPLPVVTIDHYSDAGIVEFQLYRANKLGGQLRGEVVVMEADGNYPITIREFARQARGREWGKLIEPALDALSSGYFEGVIRCKNVQLHPERTKFEYNDALMELYLAVGDWFEQEGQSYYESEQDLEREERYEVLGNKSMGRLRDLLRRPDFARLWEGFRAVVEVGRIGEGHLEPERGQDLGQDSELSVRSYGSQTKKSPTEDSSGSSRQTRPQSRSGDMPFGVIGSHGEQRRLVKDDSQGLWFEYGWLQGSSQLWEFDFKRGILTFNVRHPLWVRLDETDGKRTAKNDRWIMHLQEWLALQVLHLVLEHRTPEEFEMARKFIDGQVKPYVEMFIIGSSASPR